MGSREWKVRVGARLWSISTASTDSRCDETPGEAWRHGVEACPHPSPSPPACGPPPARAEGSHLPNMGSVGVKVFEACNDIRTRRMCVCACGEQGRTRGQQKDATGEKERFQSRDEAHCQERLELLEINQRKACEHKA